MSHAIITNFILDGQSCRRTERRVQLSSISRFMGMMSHVKKIIDGDINSFGDTW